MSFVVWKSCASQRGHVGHGDQGRRRWDASLQVRKSRRWHRYCIYMPALELGVRSGADKVSRANGNVLKTLAAARSRKSGRPDVDGCWMITDAPETGFTRIPAVRTCLYRSWFVVSR